MLKFEDLSENERKAAIEGLKQYWVKSGFVAGLAKAADLVHAEGKASWAVNDGTGAHLRRIVVNIRELKP